MNSTLPKELSKFSGLCNRLKQIFSETKKSYQDINNSGRCDGTQIINTALQKEEESEITLVTSNHPAFIVFGQTAYAKSRIVNELLNRSIFHPLDENSSIQLKMIKIVQGTKKTKNHLPLNDIVQTENPDSSLKLPDNSLKLSDSSMKFPDSGKKLPNSSTELQKSSNKLLTTIRLADIEVPESDKTSNRNDSAEFLVTQNHPLLKYGTQIIVSPSCQESQIEETVMKCTENVIPVVIYGFASDALTELDVLQLAQISKQTNWTPIFFVRVPPPGSRTVDTDPPDGGPGDPPASPSVTSNHHQTDSADSTDGSSMSLHITSLKTSLQSSLGGSRAEGTDGHVCPIYEQLKRLRYLDVDPDMKKFKGFFSVDSYFIEKFTDFESKLSTFTGQVLQNYLANASTLLNTSHTRCLNMFVLSAFDMARDMLVTPKKLEFVREKEDELYKSLLKISVSKLAEIKQLITETISIIRNCLIEEAAEFDFIGIEVSENGSVRTVRELKVCEEQIRELVLGRLNHIIAGKVASSVEILRDSYTGTLTRCLEGLETLDRDAPEGDKTTDALRQILNAAYTVEITVRSSSSFIKNILEKMKQLVTTLPWRSSTTVDKDWKRRVATEMLTSLSESRLAKSISLQIRERLNKSHVDFANALKQLETRHSGRLDQIEEHRLSMRKVHAPRLARLTLESTSLKDVILYDMPQTGKEIGRGQYGVVYSCDKWGGHSPCAVKSVVPPDDKHWNDLALEFFYTKNIPEHDRIVMLRGSVIDYMYGGGTSPSVLLVMDRLQRDLHTAIRQGLDWIGRLQVAIDVVEGLRYLHSQGLVHRDVKLKNVLLDKDNRGKITDLGFCKPEVMMSGSIVGTPIHMAPELFTGHYDNSVDVYAFGILFWYVCAGHVHLPNTFEQCANKDQLWDSVKQGLRPEQPEKISEECWKLMQVCWDGEPQRRPFFGEVESTLKNIYEKDKRKAAVLIAQQKASSGGRKYRSSSRKVPKPVQTNL